MIWQSVMAAITVSAMILAIMAMSKMFTQLLAFTGATSQLVDLVANLGYGPLTMLIIMLAVPFLLCMFIDTIAVGVPTQLKSWCLKRKGRLAMMASEIRRRDTLEVIAECDATFMVAS